MQFGREWTKFAVRFREVSALERVPLQRYGVQFGREWTKFAVRFREVSALERDPLQRYGVQFGRQWTKFAVRFRELSALERVPLQRYKCNSAGSGPNLLSGLERVDCTELGFIVYSKKGLSYHTLTTSLINFSVRRSGECAF